MTVGKSQLVLKRKPYHDMVMGHCSEHKDLEVFVCLFVFSNGLQNGAIH